MTNTAAATRAAKTEHITRGKPKQFYVSVLMKLLPHLLNAGCRLSKHMRGETDYQANGYTFALAVAGCKAACCCRKAGGTWTALPNSPATVARCDYVIEFRDIDFAFAVFTGSMSLKDALAARLFTTRGPNNTGVALTYMFDVLLRHCFFFRGTYRKK